MCVAGQITTYTFEVESLEVWRQQHIAWSLSKEEKRKDRYNCLCVCVLSMEDNSNTGWVWWTRGCLCTTFIWHTARKEGRECNVSCTGIKSTVGYCVMIHCELWLENPVQFIWWPCLRKKGQTVCVFDSKIVLHRNIRLAWICKLHLIFQGKY